MNNNLRAALVLTLKDELSAGLENIRNIMGGIRAVGQQLSLGRLQNAGSVLRGISTEASGLVGHLKQIVASARTAGLTFERMKAATTGWASRTFGAQSRVGALGSAMEGFSVVEPIRSYAEFENLARQSAITKGLSGAAAAQESQRLMTLFSKEALASGQTSSSVGEAYLDLQRMGIPASRIEEILAVHSRAATAYGISAADLGAPAMALLDTMKISDKDFGGALASMALAAQSGRFKVGDFARFLPGMAGTAAKLGMTGRGGADALFAALETVMKNASEPGQGATEFTELLNYVTSPMGTRSLGLDSKGMGAEQRAIMSKYHLSGINIDAVLHDAAAKGINPLEAIVGTLRSKVGGLDPTAMSEALGAYIHDTTARNALVALLLHRDDYLSLKGKLGQADESKVTRDWQTEMASPQAKLAQTMEQLTQLARTTGAAFLPILIAANAGLLKLGEALDWVDRLLPGMKGDILLLAGGLMAFGAAWGVISLLAPAVSAGFSMLWGMLRVGFSAVRLVWSALSLLIEGIAGIAGVSAGLVAAVLAIVAVLAAAAYDIYANWGEFKGFFEQLWQGLKDTFGGFGEFVAGVFTGDLDMAVHGIMRVWNGVAAFYGALWEIVRQLFIDFGTWVDGWTGGAMTAAVTAIKGAWQGLTGWFATLWADIRRPFDELVNDVLNNPLSRLIGLSKAAQQGPGGAAGNEGDGPNAGGLAAQHVTGQISVGVDPANGQLKITRTESSTPGFSILGGLPDWGLAAGLP